MPNAWVIEAQLKQVLDLPIHHLFSLRHPSNGFTLILFVPPTKLNGETDPLPDSTPIFPAVFRQDAFVKKQKNGDIFRD